MRKYPQVESLEFKHKRKVIARFGREYIKLGENTNLEELW